MHKYHLVSDVLHDLVIDVEEEDSWSALLNIINDEWADGKIKILRVRPGFAEPEIWEPVRRKIYIEASFSSPRWIKCIVFCRNERDVLVEEFKNPLISADDVQYLMGRAVAAGLVLTEGLSDVYRLQAEEPDDTASKANRKPQRRDILKRVLVKELETIKAEGGPVPAADNLWTQIQGKYSDYHVTRGDVRQVHREVFGELGPGKRRRDG